jgi:hypothetical protein
LELAYAKARGEGLGGLTKQPAEMVSDLHTQTSATIQLLELRTKPGGELDTAHKVAALRQSALDDELRLTDNIVHYREASLQVELDLRQKIADVQHKQLEEIKGPTQGLLHTLFTQPSSFGKQLTGTLRDAALKPVESGMSEMIARALHPVIFGATGQGGISGALNGIFGGSHTAPLGTLSDPIAVRVVGSEGGTAAAIFSGGGGMADRGYSGTSPMWGGGGGFVAPGFSGLVSGGLGMATMLAGGLAFGSPAMRMRGGELIGGGDSTAGLTQLSSGLWQRGPGVSGDSLPGGSSGFSGTSPMWGGGGGFGFAAPGFSGMVAGGLNAATMLAGGVSFAGGWRGSRTSDGEVVGGGDSTAGLTQLSSGLWQRGPGAGVSGGVSAPLGGFSGGDKLIPGIVLLPWECRVIAYALLHNAEVLEHEAPPANDDSRVIAYALLHNAEVLEHEAPPANDGRSDSAMGLLAEFGKVN